MNFYLITLGCPKNQVDSEMMAELLMQAGHHVVEYPEEADILIANTCGFIRNARRESLRNLRELAAHKRRDQLLIAAGCLAQREAERLCREVPQIDGVLGTRSWPEIVSLIKALQEHRERPLVIVRQENNLVASVPRRALLGQTAYIKIADGCDAGCAFCAIPLIKGPQVSKPMEDILREARELVDQGVQEIILIAQDTTAYGRDLGLKEGLSQLLLRLVEQVPEVGWIRILYAYPQHVSDTFIATMASLPQVCHYLDIPLQHSHPDVLRRMRRPHDVVQVRDRIAALRAAMPDIALRTTFIVGFPGETEAEFEALLDFMREMRFEHVGVLGYSRERGTLAASMPDQVPRDVILQRYERAMLTQLEISEQLNQTQIGRQMDILVDGFGEGLTIARSYRDAPEIDGMILIRGEHDLKGLVPAKIVGAHAYDLIAELL